MRLGPSHRRKRIDPSRRASNSCLESTSRPFVPKSQSSKCCGCSTSKPPGVAAIIFAVIVRSRAVRRTPSWQILSPAATVVSPAAPGAPNSASGPLPPTCRYTPPRSTSPKSRPCHTTAPYQVVFDPLANSPKPLSVSPRNRSGGTLHAGEIAHFLAAADMNSLLRRCQFLLTHSIPIGLAGTTRPRCL